MGDLQKIPSRARKAIEEVIEYLEGNDGITLNVAISYGARQEIVEACRQIAGKVSAGSLDVEYITMDCFANNLFTYLYND